MGDYLRCHEFRSTTECACSRSIVHVFLAQTVIRNLDVAIQGEQNVVKFQVAINDTILMEILERQAHFRSIKPAQYQGRTWCKCGRRTYCALLNPNWPL
jgi:hypothetical protein